MGNRQQERDCLLPVAYCLLPIDSLASFFLLFVYETQGMDKEKKNRSGSQSNRGSDESKGNRGKSGQPGAPAKSNRHEKDDSNGSDRNTTKKGENAV